MNSTECYMNQVPIDCLCACASFLDTKELIKIAAICKLWKKVCDLPSSYNNTIFSFSLLWQRNNFDENSKEFLQRFANCTSIHFERKCFIDPSILRLLIESWSLTKRKNVETLYFDQSFNNKYLDLIKQCFPLIERIFLTEYCEPFGGEEEGGLNKNTSIISLIRCYSSSLKEVNINFSNSGHTSPCFPYSFIKCIEFEAECLNKFTFGGMTLDLNNNGDRDRNDRIFTMPITNKRSFDYIDPLNDDNDFRNVAIPVCSVCLALNLNSKFLNKIDMKWCVCDKCIEEKEVNNLNLQNSLSNVQELKLKFRLIGQCDELDTFSEWVDITNIGNKINKLIIQIELTRCLWSNTTSLLKKKIGELINKMVNNDYTKNIKHIIFEIGRPGSGNATYLYLFENLLSFWIKSLSESLLLKDRENRNSTKYIVEIMIAHDLPEVIYVDEYHYKPKMIKSILNIFNEMDDENIYFRLIFKRSLEWIQANTFQKMCIRKSFHQQLKHKNFTSSQYKRNDSICLVYNNSIDNNHEKQQQLLFNNTCSTIIHQKKEK